MPEEFIPLAEIRRQKAAAASAPGGGGEFVSLAQIRAQKAQAAPAVPRAESRVLNDDLGFTKDPEWVAPQLLPKTPWEQASSFGTRDYFGREAQRKADAEQVRLDEEEAKDAPYRGLIQQFDKSAVGEAAGAIGEMLSRSASNVKHGVVQPLQNEWDALNADPLRFMPGRFGKNIAGTGMNALRSALGGVSAPFAPIAASGQIVDEKYGVRDAKTGLPVQGSGTPGLDPYGMNKRKPGILDQIVGMARVPEMGMAGVSAIGRSTADVPRVLMGGDPLDENATPEAAKELADLGFQATLPFVIPALRGRMAASSAAAERGALARGLAATPEPLVRSADLMPDRPVAPQTFKPLRVPSDAALDAGGKPSVSVKPQTSTGTAAAPAQGVAIVGRKGVRRFTDGAQAQEFAKTRGLSVTERTAGDGSGRVWYEVETPSAKPSPVASPESSPLVASTQTPDAPATSAQPAPPAPPRPMTGEAVPPEVARQAVGGVEAIPPERPLKPSLPRSGRGKASVPERPFVPPEPEAPQPVGVSAVGGEPVAPAKVGAAWRPEKPSSSKPATVRPSDAALGGAKPELVPPPGEGTVPTRGERAIEAQGGPEAVAAKTGRVVVEQADGTKLLVAEAERPRAEALAAEGKLAEFVNGEGTSPKPAAPTEAVIARDASGAEVRTVLTDTPDKTASAVAAQEAQGLKVEVVPANEGTIGKVLEARRLSPIESLAADADQLPPKLAQDVRKVNRALDEMPAYDATPEARQAWEKKQAARQQAASDLAEREGISWDEAYDRLEAPLSQRTIEAAPAPRELPAPASAKEPWQMSREEFQRQNPHDPRVGSDPITRGKEFDALPDDADVWVFHATDAATAESMLRNGVRSADKPRTLARERYAAGEEARFSPGNGLGDGLYVGSSPVGVEGYGRRILAIRVKKSQVVVPPEGASLGKTRGLALADSDASVRGDIPAAAIKEVASDGARRYARGHEALVRKALSDGKPVPPEVLAEYPDLAPNAPKIQDGSPAPAPEAPAPASAPRVAPREVTEARVSKLEQTRARLREEFNRRRDALGPVPAEEAAWLERNAKLEALQAEYGQKLRDATREIEAEPSSRKPAPAPRVAPTVRAKPAAAQAETTRPTPAARESTASASPQVTAPNPAEVARIQAADRAMARTEAAIEERYGISRNDVSDIADHGRVPERIRALFWDHVEQITGSRPSGNAALDQAIARGAAPELLAKMSETGRKIADATDAPRPSPKPAAPEPPANYLDAIKNWESRVRDYAKRGMSLDEARAAFQEETGGRSLVGRDEFRRAYEEAGGKKPASRSKAVEPDSDWERAVDESFANEDGGGSLDPFIDETPAPAPKGRLKGPRAPGMRKRGEGGFVDVGAVVKGAGDAAKAVASGAENVVKATIDRFEKDYGKAGRALADELLNVETQKRINLGKVFTDSNREYGKLGRGERAEVSKNLRSWVEGKTVIPAKFAPLVKEVRASLSTMADVLDESGVRVADEGGPRKIHRVGETYFPRAFDQDWLKAIREENKPGHTGPTPLTDEWKAMNGNTTDNPWLPKPTVSRSRLDPSFYSANELPRKFKYPEKALAEDQWAAFEQHVQRSSANAAEHRVFQYRDLAGGGGKSLGRLEQLVEAAAQENKKGDTPQSARGAVEDMTLHALGRHESVFGDSWTKKLAEGEALYQSGTKLAINPFNMAQQVSQLVNNITTLGMKATAGGVSRALADFTGSTAKAQRKGVIRPEAYSTSLDLTEGTPGKMVQGARRVVRTLSRGSELLDRLGRLTTAEVAPETLKQAEAALKAGGKEAAKAERMLREVRMSESDIAALRDGTASEFVRRKFEILLNGMVNIEGGAMMRPKWVNSLDNFAPGAGQIAYRFKNYPVQQMKVAKYAIKEAANGNFRPAVRMATWTIVHGEALAKLREALWGEDEQRKDWDEIIENRDWGALSYRLGQDVALSGTLGMAGSFIPPLMGKDKSGRTMATAEKQMTPPIASSARNYWAAAKDAMGRKTMTEDGPRFRNGRPDRPMDREDAFWQELDELVRREVPAYRTVREHTDDTPTDSRSRKR